MPNVDFPTQPEEPTQPKTRSNCLMVAGVSCLVLIIIGAVVGIWLGRTVVRNPAFKQAFGATKMFAECQFHLQDPNSTQDIYDALERYKTRHGKYPEKLGEVLPFLEDKSVLHCPADPGDKDSVSYDYYPPKPGDPGATVIVECKRHIILKDQPPYILQLCKNGQVLKHGFNPHGGPAETKPGE